MKKIKLFLSISVLALVILIPTFSFAVIDPEGPDSGGNKFIPQGVVDASPIKSYSSAQDLIHNIVVIIFDVFFVVAVLFFLLAGYNFLMGGQDEKKIATAKNQLKWGAIAIVVALLAGGVSLVIGDVLNTAI